MATFLNTIRRKLRSETALTKTQMKNIYLRNVNETDEGEDILFMQALSDQEIGPILTDYLCQNTSKTLKAIPDVDVWDMKASKYTEKDALKKIAENDSFVVTAKEVETETCGVRHYIRVYSK